MKEKKYFRTYDDAGQKALLESIINDKELPELSRLVIGCWDFESGDCSDLVAGIIANKEKFAHIESLFWGDIDSEETEISWIEQTDLSELIKCFPKLTDLTIKGTNSLDLGTLTLPNLKSLEIISGGLNTEIVENIVNSSYPNLERLMLYVGIEDYGFGDDISVFKPLLSKAKYPKLKYLGITNAEDQKGILEMILESDILPQLSVLDISYGVFKDEGGQVMLDNADKLKHLESINIVYNYLSDGMVTRLENDMPCKVDASDNQEIEIDEDDDDFDYSSPMITE